METQKLELYSRGKEIWKTLNFFRKLKHFPKPMNNTDGRIQNNEILFFSDFSGHLHFEYSKETFFTENSAYEVLSSSLTNTVLSENSVACTVTDFIPKSPICSIHTNRTVIVLTTQLISISQACFMNFLLHVYYQYGNYFLNKIMTAIYI